MHANCLSARLHNNVQKTFSTLVFAAAFIMFGGTTAFAADATVNCVPYPPANVNYTVAQKVYGEGRRLNVSHTVMLAGFEAAKVESNVNNCSNGHSTSAGVFQQLNTWGTLDQRTTVTWAANQFFTRAINAERTLGVNVSAGRIAQEVQRSAYPTRYDQAQAAAEQILAHVTPAIEAVANGGGTRLISPSAYIDVSSSGQVYAWNTNYYGGSPSGYTGRFTDAKTTRGNGGYWLLTSAGQIYAYGNAPYKGGSPTGYTGEFVALAATPDGQGYTMVSSAGQVYAYGSAAYKGGSPTGYTGKFVDIEMTTTGAGYWLLTSAGQIYAYGDAVYYGGSPTGFDRAIVAMSPTPDSRGYVLVSKTGQVYAYGNAAYRGGSPAGIPGEIADISYTNASGYLLISTQGAHYAYGDAPFIANPTGYTGQF